MKEEQSKQDVRGAVSFFLPGISGSSFWRFRLRADGMEEVRLRVSAPLYYI